MLKPRFQDMDAVLTWRHSASERHEPRWPAAAPAFRRAAPPDRVNCEFTRRVLCARGAPPPTLLARRSLDPGSVPPYLVCAVCPNARTRAARRPEPCLLA